MAVNSVFVINHDGAYKTTNMLQRSIEVKPENAGKYVVSFVRDSNRVNYFVVPDVDVNGIWVNGLDGKEKVTDCLQLFESQQLATDCLQSLGNGFMGNGYSTARVFKTIFNEQDQSLELCCVEEFCK
jgi:hypothetical protein